jgi:hypothetical protein
MAQKMSTDMFTNILYGNNMLASMCIICKTSSTSNTTVQSFNVFNVLTLDCIPNSDKLDQLKFLTATIFTKLQDNPRNI